MFSKKFGNFCAHTRLIKKFNSCSINWIFLNLCIFGTFYIFSINIWWTLLHRFNTYDSFIEISVMQMKIIITLSVCEIVLNIPRKRPDGAPDLSCFNPWAQHLVFSSVTFMDTWFFYSFLEMRNAFINLRYSYDNVPNWSNEPFKISSWMFVFSKISSHFVKLNSVSYAWPKWYLHHSTTYYSTLFLSVMRSHSDISSW